MSRFIDGAAMVDNQITLDGVSWRQVLGRWITLDGTNFRHYWPDPATNPDIAQAFLDALSPAKTTGRFDTEHYARDKVGGMLDSWAVEQQDRTHAVPFLDALAPAKTTASDTTEQITRAKTAAMAEQWVKSIHSFNGPSAPPSGISLTDTSACVFGNAAPDYGVLVGWTNGDGAAQTRIYRAGGLVHTAAAGVSSWEDPSPGTGSKTYEVRHYKNGIESAGDSDTINVAALQCSPAAAPTGLAATDTSSCAACVATYAAHLAWTNGDAAAQTRIYRGGVLKATVAAGVATWDDGTGGLSAAAFAYEVRHYRNGVESTGSSDNVTLTNPCVTPSVPALTITVLGKTSIQIESTIVPDGGSVTVYRSGTSTVVGTLNDANSWALVDSGRSPNTQYCYEGVANAGSGGCSSVRSSSTCGTTWPTNPLSLSADRISETQVDLTWSVGTRTTTPLEWQRDDGSGYGGTNTLAAGTEAYSDTTAIATTEFYRFRFQGEATWSTAAVPT